MKILLTGQVNENKIKYNFNGEIITATVDGISETFDFTGVPEGVLVLRNGSTGEKAVVSELPINPIISAEKRNGILYIELLNWIGLDATYEERFPEWIDAKDYEYKE